MKMNIYNGTNHENIIYNPKDCYSDRRGKHFLQKIDSKPVMKVGRNQPLCAQVMSGSLEQSDEFPIFFSDSMSYITLTPLDKSPYEYDIIIVSSLYATLAMQSFGTIDQNTLDRLYVPVPLYDNYDHTKKIGCAGLKKVYRPFTPQEYVSQIKSGYMPSLASIKVCIEWFAQCGRPIDPLTLNALEELKRYIITMSTAPKFFI